MDDIHSSWRSQQGEQNAQVLREQFPAALGVVAEVDALGHRVLERAIRSLPGDRVETVVGAALVRRLIVQFVGIRHLFEASAVDQSKPLIRSLFETRVALKALLHESRGNGPLASQDTRESRARYYYVAAERRTAYAYQAMLDGVGGEPVRAVVRPTIAAEHQERLERLERHYPEEHRAFGPMRYTLKGRERRYYDSKEWFSFARLDAAPASLRSLATTMGYEWEYEVLYGALSGTAHARGISHDVRLVPPGTLEVFHPYMADAFQLLCHWSVLWQLDALGSVQQVYTADAIDDGRAIYLKTRPILDSLDNSIPDGFL